MRNKLACLSMQDFDPSDCFLIRNLAEIVYAHQSSCLIPPGNIGADSSELDAGCAGMIFIYSPSLSFPAISAISISPAIRPSENANSIFFSSPISDHGVSYSAFHISTSSVYVIFPPILLLHFYHFLAPPPSDFLGDFFKKQWFSCVLIWKTEILNLNYFRPFFRIQSAGNRRHIDPRQCLLVDYFLDTEHHLPDEGLSKTDDEQHPLKEKGKELVTDKGKQGKTSVSITRHGKRKAFSRACTIRCEKENARPGIAKVK
jgi:hypothetical protein